MNIHIQHHRPRERNYKIINDNIYLIVRKKKIAREFGLPQHIYLESWITSLSVLRNCIAHHARLWNRKFPWKPQLPKKLSSNWINNTAIQHEKLYPQLCCINYLLKGLNADTKLSSDIQNLLEQYPNIDISAMGFPENWRKEPPAIFCRTRFFHPAPAV